MAKRPSTLFGMIAVEFGYMTKAVLDKLLSVQKQSVANAPLGMLAVRGQKLKPEQVEQILSTQHERRRAWLEEELDINTDVDFAVLAMERGLLNEHTVEKCVEEQKRIHSDGGATNFAEVCAAKGGLLPGQLEELLAVQSRNVSICPQCGSEIDKEEFSLKGEVLCRNCSSKLREEMPEAALKPTDDPFSLLLSGREKTAPETDVIGGKSAPAVKPTDDPFSLLLSGRKKTAPETDVIEVKPAPAVSIFDSSVKLFKNPGDVGDLREKVTGVAIALKSRTAEAFSAFAPAPTARPKSERLTAARLSTLAESRNQTASGPVDMETFREPTDHEFFLAALEEEAAMTESSGLVSTDALRNVMKSAGQSGPTGSVVYRADTQGIRRDDEHSEKTETQEISLEQSAWDKAAVEALEPESQGSRDGITPPYFGAEEELESFFSEPDTDVIELTPLADAAAQAAESIDKYETSEMLEHELPDSSVYDRAALIAASKIPASPPQGADFPQKQWRPPTRETLREVLSASAESEGKPSWRLPTQRTNWFVDNWLMISVVAGGAGLIALIVYVVYKLIP